MLLLCKRRIKIRKACWLFSCILCGTILWFIWSLFAHIQSFRCSDEDSRHLLEITCNSYRQGFIVGNLCPLMCEENKVKYEKCTNYKAGKTVMIMTCDDVCSSGETIQAVLKSHFPDINKFKKTYLKYDSLMYTTLPDFMSMLAESIWFNLDINISKSEDVIKSVFQWDYEKYINPPTIQKYKAFTLSVWSLVQQNEYLTTKLHQHNPLFPQIYHSCGSFYLMESAPPGDVLDPSLAPWKFDKSSWQERASVAVKLLDAILTMESEFHQPLHMCDLKGENFGLGMDGLIKLIDTDSVLFHSKLSTELTSDMSCHINADCNFWDCHGNCDSDRKCLKTRLNNNLQSICEDVFMSSMPGFNNGLLRNPPSSIKEELKILLNDCVYPDGPDQKATSRTYWKLYHLLKSTV